LKLLVTGAGGKLGRALRAAAAGREVVALESRELDIRQLDRVVAAVEQHSPDAVINAAAFTDVDGAELQPEAAFAANAVGPRNLALATARRGIPLVHVSTDYVFDGRATRPYHEFDSAAPLSAYGRSKLAGEEEVRCLNARHHVVRTAWLYHTEGASFVNTMRSLAGQAEVRVVSDQFGSPTFAPHLAAALLDLAGSEAYGLRHLAGQGGASWYELAAALFEALGAGTTAVPVSSAEFPRPARRPRYSVLTTIQEPRIVLPPWEEGIREYARLLNFAD
jgi:dTDP-4-dehydrorhamnose reductase